MLLNFWLCSMFVFGYFEKIQSVPEVSDHFPIGESNSILGNQLHSVLAKKDKNLIFSPLSLHAALSLLYVGTGGNSETLIAKVLHFDNQNDTSIGYHDIVNFATSNNVTLAVTDKVYFKEGVKIRDEYRSNAIANFNTELENINFADSKAAANTINAWVESKTNHKIKNLLAPTDLSSDTRLVLVNTVYFNGPWRGMRFQVISKRKFYTSKSDTVDCTMIHKKGEFLYLEEDDTQLIRLPYKDPRISLVIILPRSKSGISEIIKRLPHIDWNSMWQGIEEQHVRVTIPKFKIESTIDLKDALSKIGLESIFGGIDVSKMVDYSEPLRVSKVLQKVYIDVNEDGTEAAAATAIGNIAMSAMTPEHEFTADRPFMFLLEANINGQPYVLFQGQVIKPEYN